MAIGTDFEIQNDSDIRYIGAAHGANGAGYYTVLEFHRWLQGLADDASASGDDYMDMTRATPSDKSFDTIIQLINGYNIDAVAAEHLFGGSIIQSDGAQIYDGVQIIAQPGAHVEIVQDGALIAGDFWNSVPFGTSDKGLNPDAGNGVSHRFMVLVRTGGADIDGRRLLFQTREWGKTFSEFRVNGTARGVNVVPLTFVDDLNNTTAEGTVATWTTITNTSQGYTGIDVNNDGSNEFYYSEWDRSTFAINQFYERMKWISRRGSATTLYGLSGEIFRGITHQIAVDNPSGTFNAFEPVSWSGGTGQMLAINSPTAPTTMWIQLLTGSAPTDNQTITGGTSSASCQVNVTVTERAISFPFCGASTGSAIIGAYGFGLEALDLTASDRVFDLTNTQRTPPNFVTFSVNGVVAGEDYVLVAPNDGSGGIEVDQFTLNGALTGAAVTSVAMNQAIPSDTPASGTIRILRSNGAYTRHAYSSYSGSTFTLTNATNFTTNSAPNGTNAYVTYIDRLAASSTESFTTVYGSDRSLFIRVRDGGVTPIKTFETTGTLSSAGGSATAVRTSDA